MATTNEELIRKAVITADALAAAGKLNPQQSDKFIDYVVDETVLRGNARVVRFNAETLQIDKIGVGARVAVPKAEASDPNVRRGVTTSKVELTPKEIMVPVEIGDTFAEINIEGEDVKDTIMRLFARQLGNNLEELYINGDLLGRAVIESEIRDGGSDTQYIKDSYLALQDGWLRAADSGNVVDVESTNIGLSVFSKLLRALPTKFRRNKAQLRWFVDPDLWEMYLERLATRATALGDAAAGGGMHRPLGIEAVPVPLMELNPRIVQHITMTGTSAHALRYKPVSNEVVTKYTLGGTPETPYAITTDYVMDYVNGTIARNGGGSIGDGEVVKVTYDAKPQVMLTHMNNLIIGIGRDIRIEKDRDIFKGTDQYAITCKVSVNFEETSALAKAVNIGTP